MFGGILGEMAGCRILSPILKKPLNNQKKIKNLSIGESESEKTTKPQKFQQFSAWQKIKEKTFARFNCHSVNQEVRTAKNKPKKEK